MPQVKPHVLCNGMEAMNTTWCTLHAIPNVTLIKVLISLFICIKIKISTDIIVKQKIMKV